MRLRPFLGLAAILLLTAPLADTWARTILAAAPIDRLDLKWWHERHEAKLEELRQKHPSLIYLGDSIIQNLERTGPEPWGNFAPVWQRFYGDRNAVNLGFIGDTTANLLWRIDNGEVAGITPKVAVVLIGANNLGRVHWGTDDTLAGIDAVLRALHQRLPSTHVLLLGILPSERSAWATETTVAVNHALAAKYPRGGYVTFVDAGHVFLRNGTLNRDLFYDPKLIPPNAPLHPTAQGHALLAEAIEPTLAGLMGDRVHR